MSKSREYDSWKWMIDRVDHDPEYQRKGITVCNRWRDFINFYADMGEKPAGERISVERRDNAGNYEPGNCEWSNPRQQNNNKGNNVVIPSEQFGQKTLTEWAGFLMEHTGDTSWKPRILQSHLKRMTIDQILKGLDITATFAQCSQDEDDFEPVAA